MADLNTLSLTVSCDSCPVREVHCGDCMVSFLTDPARHEWELPLSEAERDAAAACVRAGLICAQDVAWARANPTSTARAHRAKVS